MSEELFLGYVQVVLPYIAAALPFIAGLIGLIARNRLRLFTRETVAAVYRVAIKTASDLQDEGLLWLRGPGGIAFRKQLAQRAYDLMPASVGAVPIGTILKMVVSREKFTEMVESAFMRMADLAEKLEFPDELPEIVLPPGDSR